MLKGPELTIDTLVAVAVMRAAMPGPLRIQYLGRVFGSHSINGSRLNELGSVKRLRDRSRFAVAHEASRLLDALVPGILDRASKGEL